MPDGDVARFALAEPTGSVGRVVFLAVGGVLAGFVVFFGAVAIGLAVQKGALMDPRSVRRRRWVAAVGSILAVVLGLCVMLASFENGPRL